MQKVRCLFIVLTLIFSPNLLGQNKNPDTDSKQAILRQIEVLDNSLLEKNIKVLTTILHQDLTLGHSNGWVETKETLLQSLPGSKVVYKEFRPFGATEIKLGDDDIATVRRNLTAVGEYKTEVFDVDLKLLEIWICKDGIWQLLARQSVEVDFEE